MEGRLRAFGVHYMRHSRWIQAGLIVLVTLVTLSIGSRPAIQAGQPSSIVASATVGGGFGGEDESRPNAVHAIPRPMSKEAMRVWLKLQEKIPMAFPNETPLEDILKYLRESTVEKA